MLSDSQLLYGEVSPLSCRRGLEGTLTEPRGRGALKDLADLPVRREAHHVLLGRIWSLRENATAYDAVYLALAEALGATLLTRDAALASVPGVKAPVEVL